MYFYYTWGIVIVLFCADIGIGDSRRLNDFIRHYETLDYDTNVVHEKHMRLKRWLRSYDERYKEEPPVSVKFTAHNRRFHLLLRRDTETFSQDFNLHGEDIFPAHETPSLFTGHLEDVPGSYVHGSVVRGVFGGKIAFPEETFFVERSPKYFQGPQSLNNSFHSIIYSERDLEHPGNHQGSASGHAGCGISEKIHDWMKKVAKSEIKPQSIFDDFLNSEQSFNSMFALERDHEYLNETSANFRSPLGVSRRKREIEDTLSPMITMSQKATTCTLFIKTDPMFWKEIAKQQGTKDKAMIREEILSVIGQHVKAANDIFSSTLFKWNEEMFKNIRFVVQTVKIDMDEECDPANANATTNPNPFCAEHIDVSNFLEIHSRGNHESFCLSYAFTYRDFSDGVIGLAWVGSVTAAGGICQKQGRYYDDSNTSKTRSLNTGIVTFLNYGRHLPSRLSELTFIHELGHNFGSPHDPKDCQPGGNKGNYIMYASSTNGYLPNNVEFSECSIRSMSEVLNQAFNSPTRPNCFIATDGAFCGNSLVEEGEECDCGYDMDECKENCCYPLKSTEKIFPAATSGALSCKRKPNALCSPSEGPCCQDTCQFSTRSDHGNIPCRKATECSKDSFCGGASAQCPTPPFKPDNTECNKGSQVCIEGECRGSICLKFGLEECFLSSSEYSNKRELCKIACVDGNGFCKPTSELGIPHFQPNLSLRPGSPCDNFKGYCDVFQKCRAVDEKGPLLRLKRLFFNRVYYRGVFDWCLKNWYWVCLMSIVFVVLMGLFIKCCAVHTPSSNPNMAKRVKLTQTLRKPINSLRKQPKPERNRGPGYGSNGGEERIPMEPRYP